MAHNDTGKSLLLSNNLNIPSTHRKQLAAVAGTIGEAGKSLKVAACSAEKKLGKNPVQRLIFEHPSIQYSSCCRDYLWGREVQEGGSPAGS